MIVWWSTDPDDSVPLLNSLCCCNSVLVLAFVLLAPYVSTGTGATGACRRLSLYSIFGCVLRNDHQPERSSLLQAKSNQLAYDSSTTSQLVVGTYMCYLLLRVCNLCHRLLHRNRLRWCCLLSPRTSLLELASALPISVVLLP
jgi:hypothetical protein